MRFVASPGASGISIDEILQHGGIIQGLMKVSVQNSISA